MKSMHDLPLLINIAMALVAAFIGGVIARRLKLPTIVGYLLAGIVIGPFTPGFVGDVETISQLAELGVIFLMFGVGLHFSFKDLWKVRSIAIPGAVVQMTTATILGYALSQTWGWQPAAGIVLGLAVSIASTVVLLRGLMDNGLLNTPHGQAAVGWLVLEDLATVLILILMPGLSNASTGFDWGMLGLTLLKAAAFVLVVLFIGMRLIPWLLLRIAYTRSRELFILAVLVISLGTALGAAEVFGVSLALGAFVAGVVVSESPLSHQVGADALPFREAFAVLFFVSIGMLVNPAYLFENIGAVLVLTVLIVIGKPLITLLQGLVFPWQARTVLVVAGGLSQIGEFSFILGQAGVSLGILSQDQYSLVLAGALISITINPLMFRLVTPAESWLRRIPGLWKLLNRHGPSPAPIDESISDHVVIVGYGRVGQHLASVLREIGIPYLVVESDASLMQECMALGVPTLFGDAANSEVITHSGLKRARAMAITIHDEAAGAMIVGAAHNLAPDLPIITRAESNEGALQLAQLGAKQVIRHDLEGGLELVSHTLMQLGFPAHEINSYTDAVRQDHYNSHIDTDEEHHLLQGLIDASRSIEISWIRLRADNPLVGQMLEEADIRRRTGASVVAILRDGQLLANPKSVTVFEAGDQVGLIGEAEQIEAVKRLLEA
jgi:CPA2 family monovalent cation:H+ antiporter-2